MLVLQPRLAQHVQREMRRGGFVPAAVTRCCFPILLGSQARLGLPPSRGQRVHSDCLAVVGGDLVGSTRSRKPAPKRLAAAVRFPVARVLEAAETTLREICTLGARQENLHVTTTVGFPVCWSATLGRLALLLALRFFSFLVCAPSTSVFHLPGTLALGLACSKGEEASATKWGGTRPRWWHKRDLWVVVM